MTGTEFPGSGRAVDDPLRVDLRVEPPAEAGCTLAGFDGEVTDVSQHLKREGCDCRSDYGECHTRVTLDDGREVRHEYLRSEVGPDCACRVFARADCIPEIRGVDDGAMEVSLILPDREALREVVDRLRETGATVRLRRAVREGDDETIEIDAAEITPKQREAIDLAVEAGYYDEPREADLGELADRLGVSKSAVSQRLSAAESTLVLSLTDGLS